MRRPFCAQGCSLGGAAQTIEGFPWGVSPKQECASGAFPGEWDKRRRRSTEKAVAVGD